MAGRGRESTLPAWMMAPLPDPSTAAAAASSSISLGGGGGPSNNLPSPSSSMSGTSPGLPSFGGNPSPLPLHPLGHHFPPGSTSLGSHSNTNASAPPTLPYAPLLPPPMMAKPLMHYPLPTPAPFLQHNPPVQMQLPYQQQPPSFYPMPMPLPLQYKAVQPLAPATSLPANPSPSTQQAPAASDVKPLDPVNDVKCWSEHLTEDKKVFWYNSVLKSSTFDKPACLKTAIERSIPNCKWKEYTTPEGKVYYSDGTESRY